MWQNMSHQLKKYVDSRTLWMSKSPEIYYTTQLKTVINGPIPGTIKVSKNFKVQTLMRYLTHAVFTCIDDYFRSSATECLDVPLILVNINTNRKQYSESK